MFQKKAFTLIEIIVAITILAVIMVSVFVIYSNIIAINRRLQAQRTLQENARIIEESVSDDMRNYGINFAYYANNADVPLDYSGNGTAVLATLAGNVFYPMKDSPASSAVGPTLCSPDDLKTQACYFWSQNNGTFTRLTDSTVKITNLRFYISGKESGAVNSQSFVGKVTMLCTLTVTGWYGSLSEESSTIHIQTTFNERPYQTDIK